MDHISADPSASLPAPHAASSDAADHVREARRRARQVLGGEAHLGAVDDWRRALTSARDAVILLWLGWAALHGLGDPPISATLLTVVAVGCALLVGMSTARATHAQVQYYAAELDREREEIRDHFDHEREEVRALYAAKGFREPLLTPIVDTLCADDDRLLKVMMEEELGLAVQHMNHPLIVGIWNAGGALLAGMILVGPLHAMSPDAAHWWMPLTVGGLLLVLSVTTARVTGRLLTELLADALIMVLVTGGVVYLLAKWLGEVPA